MTHKENYLWDKSEPADSEIQQLEETLSVLRYKGEAPKTLKRKPVHRWKFARLAIAATIVLIIGVWWIVYQPTAGSLQSWEVVALEGAATIDSKLLKSGQLEIGQWLETDNNSTAKVNVSTIGDVTVYPNSRLGLLVSIEEKEHRLKLDHGKIKAFITAPPRLFLVETPAALAVDYGCEYILEVDKKGNGELKVILGWVALERYGRQSIVPRDGFCKIRAGIGPGTPYFEDASQTFSDALDELDFKDASDEALQAVLDEARPRDTLTLWHLLMRDDEKQRGKVFDRMKALTSSVPKSITRQGVIDLDQKMLEQWWDELNGGW